MNRINTTTKLQLESLPGEEIGGERQLCIWRPRLVNKAALKLQKKILYFHFSLKLQKSNFLLFIQKDHLQKYKFTIDC